MLLAVAEGFQQEPVDVLWLLLSNRVSEVREDERGEIIAQLPFLSCRVPESSMLSPLDHGRGFGVCYREDGLVGRACRLGGGVWREAAWFLWLCLGVFQCANVRERG